MAGTKWRPEDLLDEDGYPIRGKGCALPLVLVILAVVVRLVL